MVSDNRKSPAPAGISNTGQRPKRMRGYSARNRFYGSLFLFIIVVGLPIVSVPSLRHRLVVRVVALEEAIRGETGTGLTEIGAEQAPFPEEYKKADYEFPNSGMLLPEDDVYTAPKDSSASQDYSPPALITPESAKVETVPAVAASGKAAVETDSDEGIAYTQGESELEAYALLLESFPKVSEMVKGGDASLKFESWGGSKRSADIYWIRLIFTSGDDLVEYIWQVELGERRVLPLSHNARSIS